MRQGLLLSLLLGLKGELLGQQGLLLLVWRRRELGCRGELGRGARPGHNEPGIVVGGPRPARPPPSR